LRVHHRRAAFSSTENIPFLPVIIERSPSPGISSHQWPEKRLLQRKTLYCSFCGKRVSTKLKLIAGPSVFVCDECIDLCNEIIGTSCQRGGCIAENKLICRRLPISRDARRYVIDQEPAKRTLAVAVYNHYKIDFAIKKEKRKMMSSSQEQYFADWPDWLKRTLLAQTLARTLNVPFVS
jgi:ATP-dependent Clp protease ATP-binding subunit ClpX